MTYTEPDPKIVWEIAQDALTIAIRRGRTESVEAALIAHGGAGPVLGERFDAYTSAVIAEYGSLAAVMTRLDGQSAGYPGIPGDCWRDSEGDTWVLCADGMMRMLYTDPMPWDPAGLPGEYGPMEPVG